MGWREWLAANSPEAPEIYDAIMEESGSSHQPDKKIIKKPRKMPPRCLYCKKFMGRNEGMHIFINWDWKLHIKCFEKLEDQLEKEDWQQCNTKTSSLT